LCDEAFKYINKEVRLPLLPVEQMDSPLPPRSSVHFFRTEIVNCYEFFLNSAKLLV